MFLIFPKVTIAQQTYDELVEQYIAQYKSIAIEEMQRAGIPASITLAQGIIESSAGQSPLATVANNHFGIKCHDDWNGDHFYYDDDAKQECFRKYNSAAESFKDHSDFLKTKHRYEVLFTYNPMDYRAWAKGLKQCGYATNPQYSNTLIKCIEDYDLHQWDLNEKERTRWFAKMNKSNGHHADEKQISLENESGNSDCASSSDMEQKQQRILVFNNIKCITLQENETLNDVASDFEIGINRLMRYNDISSPSQVHSGDRIYLQPKRKNGDQKFDTVRAGETMLTISREHGIQLKELYEKNKMVLGMQPIAGQVISLREAFLASVIPDSSANTAVVSEVTVPEVSSDQFHVVTKGDTLYSVSKKYSLSLKELKELNHLSSPNLYVGQRLKVSR